MGLEQNYYSLWFESFRLINQSGHTNPVQLRLRSGQNIPDEIDLECKRRGVDPHDLLTECKKDLMNKYPVGTKFHLKAKLTDRENGGMFFYSYFGWKPYEIVAPECNN